jgi:hypothetical protein
MFNRIPVLPPTHKGEAPILDITHVGKESCMFKGAIILGVGYSLGYIKGLKDAEIVAEKLQKLFDEVKASQEKTPTEVTFDSTAVDEPQPVTP